jgi:hypothetical protein
MLSQPVERVCGERPREMEMEIRDPECVEIRDLSDQFDPLGGTAMVQSTWVC